MHYHYIDMTEAIDKLAGVHNTFVSKMKTFNTNLDDVTNELTDKSWAGESADTFRKFYTDLNPVHKKMAKGVENWHSKLRTCSHPKGRAAILEACNIMLKTFNGTGITSVVGILEYEESVDSFSMDMRSLLFDVKDKIETLEFAHSKMSSLNRTYSNINIPSIITNLENYRDAFLDFNSAYYSAMDVYLYYLGEMEETIKAAGDELSTASKALEGVRPDITVQDPSSPAYRAWSFSEMLKTLPAKDRVEIQNIAYNAAEPYRTTFFGYIDKVKINGTDGTVDGGAVSLPWLGIWINVSDTSTIDINGKKIPRWYYVLFHEIGHAIDYASGATSGDTLNNAMKKDVESKLLEVGTTISKDAKLVEQAVQNIMNGKKVSEKDKDKSPLNKLQYKIQKNMERELKKPHMGSPSDQYGGITKNTVKGNASHPDIYWYIPNAPSLEIFADDFSYGMLGYSDAQQNQQDYFPTAHEALHGDPNNPEGGGIIEDVHQQATERLGR